MRLVIRLICSLVACVLLVSVASSYYQVQREKRNLRNELRKRAEVFADSLQQDIGILLQESAVDDLRRKIQRIGVKDHFLGAAIYSDQPAALAITSSLNKQITEKPRILAQAMRDDRGAGQFLRMNQDSVYFYAVPLHGAAGVIGGLLVVHDANYIASAMRRSWREMSIRVGVQVCLLALTTFLVFQRNVMKPIARTTAWMHDLRNGRTPRSGAA